MRPWLRLSNLVLLLIAVVLGTALYFAIYVFLAASPYEAVGMAINRRLPEPVRNLTCSVLSKRHPGAWPTVGCEKVWKPAPAGGAPAPEGAAAPPEKAPGN
ncbi:hypothetical protein [Pseudoxanthobacter sp.]|uniref:hypothetical protein n=1 Tax=Pseudoxanthobacter sp. TaxID=1925742 RepID=UPI002FE0F435